MYTYTIEIFLYRKWVTEIRIYHIKKSDNEFDTYDIPNKRRNFKPL